MYLTLYMILFLMESFVSITYLWHAYINLNSLETQVFHSSKTYLKYIYKHSSSASYQSQKHSSSSPYSGYVAVKSKKLSLSMLIKNKLLIVSFCCDD